MAIRRLRTRRLNVLTAAVPPAAARSAPPTARPTLPSPERVAPLRAPAAPERAAAPTTGAVDAVLGTAYSVFDDYLAEGRRFAKRHEQGGAPVSRATLPLPAPNVPADVSSVLARLARDIMGAAGSAPPPPPRDRRSRFAFEPVDEDEKQFNGSARSFDVRAPVVGGREVEPVSSGGGSDAKATQWADLSSVNTVVKDVANLRPDTDGQGLLRDVRQQFVDPADKNFK